MSSITRARLMPFGTSLEFSLNDKNPAVRGFFVLRPPYVSYCTKLFLNLLLPDGQCSFKNQIEIRTGW